MLRGFLSGPDLLPSMPLAVASSPLTTTSNIFAVISLPSPASTSALTTTTTISVDGASLSLTDVTKRLEKLSQASNSRWCLFAERVYCRPVQLNGRGLELGYEFAVCWSRQEVLRRDGVLED